LEVVEVEIWLHTIHLFSFHVGNSEFGRMIGIWVSIYYGPFSKQSAYPYIRKV
jgi:hypothetical protein